MTTLNKILAAITLIAFVINLYQLWRELYRNASERHAVGWRLVLTALAFVIARYTAGGIGMVLLIGTTRRAQARGFDMTSELRIVLTAKAGAIAGLILGSLAGYCAAGPMLMLAGAALLSLCGSVLGTRMGGIWSGRVLISDLG